MNKIFFPLIAVALSACSWGDASFYYQSTLHEASKGLTFKDDLTGEVRVGMLDTTCDFNPRYGTLGLDWDYSQNSDKVQDASPEGSILVTSKDGIYVHNLRDEYGEPDYETYNISGIKSAFFNNGGIISYGGNGGSCSLNWIDQDQITSYGFKPNFCPQIQDITPGGYDAGVFIGTVIGTQVIYPDSPTPEVISEEPANLIVWDESEGLFYAADLAENRVYAQGEDGETIWEVFFEEEIVSINDMGIYGEVAVLLRDENDLGILVILNGLDGLEKGRTHLPSSGNKIYSSDDGRQVAISDGDSVKFLERGYPIDFGYF